MKYRVTAAMVYATTGGVPSAISRDGRAKRPMYRGDVLPDDVPPQEIDHLVAGGFVEPVGAPAQPLA